jgi:hypothetical protein
MEETNLGIVDAANESGALSGDEAAGGNQEFDANAEVTPEAGSESEVTPGQEGSAGGTQGQPQQITGKLVRDAIRSMSEAHPEHAKILKALGDTHFTVATAYKAAFPTPREAQAAKSLIDGLGGVDGATSLQQRISGYDQQEAGLESGDPAVLDSFFKDYPDGAAALAPHYLERLASTNPQAFSATIAPYAISMLQQAGVDQHLAGLMNETDPARIKAGIAQLADWLGKQTQGVAQLRQQATTKAPGSDKVAQERQKLSEERENLFRSSVGERVNTLAVPALNTEVDKYAKQYKLSDDQKKHFSETLQQKIIAEMNADPNYKKQVDLRYASKSRSRETVSDFIAGEFNRRVREKAFDVVKGIYGAPKGGAQQQNQGNGVLKAGTPKTAPGGGPIKVASKPADSDLDLNRADAFDLMFKQEAWTKTGRHITWRR